MTEDILLQDQNQNSNIENHHDLEVNQVKIKKHSSHQSKILKKVEFQK